MVAFVRSNNGVQLAVPAGGLLIGRGSTCGMVVDDPGVSRRHALVLSGDRGTLIVPLGRRPTEVNGVPITMPTEVDDGASVTVGPTTFRIDIPPPPVTEQQLIEIGGQRYSVSKSSMRVGGSSEDDLVVPSWPEHALSLLPIPGAVIVEFAQDLPELLAVQGEVRELSAGQELVLNGVTMRVIVSHSGSTTTIEGVLAPTRVRLEFLPNGGLLSVLLDREYTAWLADKRCDLVAALLRPSGDFSAGEFVPDDVLVRLIWGTDAATRAQLNTLIHRARKSLTLAGLNGPALIQRAPGGGATRFAMAQSAEVSVV
jgi:hypothetical protein